MIFNAKITYHNQTQTFTLYADFSQIMEVTNWITTWLGRLDLGYGVEISVTSRPIT